MKVFKRLDNCVYSIYYFRGTLQKIEGALQRSLSRSRCKVPRKKYCTLNELTFRLPPPSIIMVAFILCIADNFDQRIFIKIAYMKQNFIFTFSGTSMKSVHTPDIPDNTSIKKGLLFIISSQMLENLKFSKTIIVVSI